MRSVELFSGCGGMATGLSQAGFLHDLMVEWNGPAVATIAHNRELGVGHAAHWRCLRADVRTMDWRASLAGAVDLVAGGPPCQPFSFAGKAQGFLDSRDMWPEAIRSVRELAPSAFLFENVRGLLRAAFADYLAWVVAHLAIPSVVRRDGEGLLDHLARLRGAGAPDYRVAVFSVDAADYGAAQNRHRVLIAGYRADVAAAAPDGPQPTHSRERLAWDQWVSGSYWERHGLTRPDGGPSDPASARLVARLTHGGREPGGLAWRTCRDAFVGLGEPGSGAHDHRAQPGARSYPGHTGSPIDSPAKALKAGGHGVPGGENMLRMPDGSVRYFTVREAARLQGLPDGFRFPGAWSESMRQLGNAVPVPLAEAFGRSLASGMDKGRSLLDAA